MFGDLKGTSRRLQIARRLSTALRRQKAYGKLLVSKDEFKEGRPRYIPMLAKRCHWNVGALYLTGKIPTIVSGFILTKAANHWYWLAHSWGKLDSGEVIETTQANLVGKLYLGIQLRREEAKRVTMQQAFSKPHLMNESLKVALEITDLPVLSK